LPLIVGKMKESWSL